MTSRERVLTALNCEIPDRIPYCELGVDISLARKIMGWPRVEEKPVSLEVNRYTVDEAKALAERLQLDNISYVLRAPIYAEKIAGKDGRLFYGEGQIKEEADLERLLLPDPEDESLYAEASEFARQKGDYACFLVTRIGIFPTMLSMGLESFSVALYENRPFLEAVLDRYCDWTAAVARHASELEFDVFVSTDDMAFKTSPYFSPQIFRELVAPRFKKVAENITFPWVVHSDGFIQPFVDDLLELGMTGLHPNEKGAMDIRLMKRLYAGRLCLLGNLDLNILGEGTPDDVEREVRELIRDVGPGGGYIVTSGNSLAAYLRPDNVLSLAAAVKRYGGYPLKTI